MGSENYCSFFGNLELLVKIGYFAVFSTYFRWVRKEHSLILRESRLFQIKGPPLPPPSGCLFFPYFYRISFYRKFLLNNYHLFNVISFKLANYYRGNFEQVVKFSCTEGNIYTRTMKTQVKIKMTKEHIILKRVLQSIKQINYFPPGFL